ncbi:MAG: 2,3-bisphosphoglycerate-independent phosphoglycerate mutase, partial [Planctomycetes bacterium]|nr:2,3-bisphosphoglycerate-independent phosphoglycerate mutase [Planctomycetota bacterium]
TGVIEAAVKAAQVVDECVGKVLKTIKQLGGSAIVTADHGNLEQMYNPQFDCSLTSHTTYPVPLYVVDEKYGRCKLRQDGRLADVVPTAFHIMALAKPEEMTGTSLIIE